MGSNKIADSMVVTAWSLAASNSVRTCVHKDSGYHADDDDHNERSNFYTRLSNSIKWWFQHSGYHADDDDHNERSNGEYDFYIRLSNSKKWWCQHSI